MDARLRETQLSELKKIANIEIELNKKYEARETGWRKSTIERNLYNLKAIVNDLNRDLRRTQIKKYVAYCHRIDELKSNFSSLRDYQEKWSKIPSEVVLQVSPTLIQFKISANAVLTTLAYDLNDLIHPTAMEIVTISRAGEEPSILIKYIPDCIKLIRERLATPQADFLNLKLYAEPILNSFLMSEKEDYASANILILPQIEGITKELIHFVYGKQNPELSGEEIYNEIYHKYTSLVQVVSKVKLKDDFPVSFVQALNDYDFSNHPKIICMDEKARAHFKAQYLYFKSLQKMLDILESSENGWSEEKKMEESNKIFKKSSEFISQNWIKDKDELVFLPLSEKLKFLLRTIPEDRNNLLHGQSHRVDNSWRNYIFLNALEKVFELADDYQKIYA